MPICALCVGEREAEGFACLRCDGLGIEPAYLLAVA